MPLPFAARSRSIRRLALAAGAAAVAASALAAGPAGAAGTTLACSTRVESQAFKPWGDLAYYFQVPNGGFEQSGGWALSGGAKAVAGNETFNVRAATDTKSLQMPAGSRAESRTICIGKGEETLRFFVKNPGVPGAILHVEVTARNTGNGAVGVSSFDINADALAAGWSPSNALRVPAMFSDAGQQEITVVFTTVGNAATWQVDDVYVDPFRSV